jgi:pimeloyl-ACP methyl ester carboxylesterase
MINNITFGTVDLNNNETMFYRETGEGDKALIFIHGNMSSSKHWEPILKTIPKGYKAFAVDLRGMGDSTYNTPIEALGDFAKDIREFMDKKNIDSAALIGWSTGGGVAMELAADYPQRVEKVVLVESVSVLGYPIFKKDEKGQMIIGQHYSCKQEMAQDPVQVVPALNAIETKNYAVMKYIWDMAIYVNKKPEEQEYKEYLDATFQQRNLVDIDWALATFNITSHHNGLVEGSGKADKITAPVLCFWGDKDVVVPKIMIDQTMMALGDRAKLEILENCGHSPITDCPEILMDKMMQFIEE